MRNTVWFVLLALLFSSSRVVAEEPIRYIYTLAAPFNTLTDSITEEELQAFWEDPQTIFPTAEISISSKDLPLVASCFDGTPGAGIIEREPSPSIDSWAIIPFEDLDPRWKVIQINGDSPIHNDFDPDTWPLTAQIAAETDDLHIDWKNVPIANRDAEKMSTIILTGVTAMVRATAQYMDILGPDYPASLIRDPLIQADILHINNEVPFAEVCNQSQEELNQLVFCSKSQYIELLQDIGTDVIELDGDHFKDYGYDAMYFTLDWYKENNMPYYGGGINKKEAQQPWKIEHNGNKFAFLGCNGKDIGYASASETSPGAVHCDYDLLQSQIEDLKTEGWMPIVTYQHIEFYQTNPNQQMLDEYHLAADAGAVIVSGSQSHIPMSFEVNQDSFIHYGLGNLFFDQAFYLPETSEAFIDRHVFYDNHYISTELLTIKFTNAALSHYTTGLERESLLERIFTAAEQL